MTNTPKTDALREVIVGQYKKDELTGNGMGNILAALADIETLERERDEAQTALDEIEKYGTEEINAAVDLRSQLAAALIERDEAREQLAAERALADRLAMTLGTFCGVPSGTCYIARKEVRND